MQKIRLYEYSHKIDKSKYSMIDIDSIVYFNNTVNNGIVACTKELNYKYNGTLDELQNKYNLFFRANKCFLINTNMIDKLLPVWVDSYRVLRMLYSNTDIYLTEYKLNQLACLLGMNRISAYTPIVNNNSQLLFKQII